MRERWQQLEQLYHAALERDPTQRSSFLNHACAGDEALRREIESLLSYESASQPFLQTAPGEFAAAFLAGAGSFPADNLARPVPSSIGSYRIVRLIGSGGMGAVYEAEQHTPLRTVALKMIKPGLAGPEILRRFEREANALGRLQHPGIAQIYEAGTADAGFGPQPYFVMELIRGPSLLNYAEAHGLSTRQRLELMAKICEAVHHAHQRGLIHRDLKPGNILVDETGQPKILDFGIARVTDSEAQVTSRTELGQVLGTLAYMSPEQVKGDPLEVDVRSDIYALGVILYELLTGRLPYQLSGNVSEAMRAIQEKDPARLSSIDRRYPSDIEIIIAKALEKDKARRYASAADFAADLRRYLADEPIMARPPSTAYQLHKFARRHKALVLSTFVILLVLFAGILASTSEAIRANRAGKQAIADRDRATRAERGATEERDRALRAEQVALRAEQVATRERNRAVAERQRADRESATAKAVNDFLLNDLLAQAAASAQAQPGTRPDPDLKVRTALDRAALRLPGKFDKRPLVEASIRQLIGDTYRELGLYPEAEPHLKRAIDLRSRLLGAAQPLTLVSLNGLGELYLAQGKYAEAERLFATVLNSRERVLGTNHAETLNTMADLAAVYREEGQYAQAESLESGVLTRELRVLGDQDRRTLSTMSNLAQVYVDEGKYGQAEELSVRGLDLASRALGEGHPQTLLCMNTLAQIYRRQGRYAKAEELYRRMLDVEAHVLGEDHPVTASSMNDLALLYRQQGKYAPAEDLYRRSLNIHRQRLGEEHPSTLAVTKNLALLLRDEGQYAEAEVLFNKVLEIRMRVLGVQHRDTLISMNDAAVLSRDQGNYPKAERLFAQVIEGWRHLFGDGHPNTLGSEDNLAVVLGEEGKYQEGERLARQVLERRRQLLGVEHPEALRTANSLAVLYRDEGQFSEAERLFDDVVEKRRRVLGAEHPDTLTTLHDMALLYERQGKFGESELLLKQVLETRQRTGQQHRDVTNVLTLLGEVRRQQNRYPEAEAPLREALAAYEKVLPDSWRRYYTLSMLGSCLAGQGQYADAEPMLIAGYEGMLQRRPTIPARNQDALEKTGASVVRLYDSWGKPEKAAEWREKITGPVHQ